MQEGVTTIQSLFYDLRKLKSQVSKLVAKVDDIAGWQFAFDRVLGAPVVCHSCDHNPGDCKVNQRLIA
jgi:hypothetical protein